MSSNRIFTVGHSSHDSSHFLELLRVGGIDVVADVRSAPYSRWVPHFNRDQLGRYLSDEAVEYVFLGAELGGRPSDPSCYDDDRRVLYDRLEKTPAYSAGIDALGRMVAANRMVCLLCSEEDPGQCHRSLSIAHVLEGRGFQVFHIRGDGRVQEHAEGRTVAVGQLSLFGDAGLQRKSVRPVAGGEARPPIDPGG